LKKNGMLVNQVFKENVRIAFASIRTNFLRTVLTITIITIGITALVGILTAIDSIKNSISSNFTQMGANTFVIDQKWNFTTTKRERRKNFTNISYREATRFKQEFQFPAIVSITTWATWQGVVKYESTKTNPNIPVLGIDEGSVYTGGYEIASGRNFSEQDLQLSRNVAIIGSELKRTLFGNGVDPLNKIIAVGNGKYKIVGVLEEKGNSFTGPGDKILLLPITNVRQYFPSPRANHIVHVQPDDPKLLDISASEAEGLFRVIRNLKASDESDFKVEKSDGLANMLIDNLQKVMLATTIIGIITLLGAAIGLMNIMLVSVSERTREIGIRKAIGARNKDILQQFLYEAIIIGQLGGLLGIVFGILIGNLVSLAIGSTFFIPWFWIFMGVVICFIVGLASGFMPARKASHLDPIVALHYE
jgi:putative ABC transport system permease protein